MTRSEITKHALEELTWRGSRVREVHAIPNKRRKGRVQPGWADIQGYTKTGLALFCEVKTELDKFSDEQTNRMNDAEKCGCVCLVAHFKQQFILESWADYKIRLCKKDLKTR